jgi:hypothetical protein
LSTSPDDPVTAGDAAASAAVRRVFLDARRSRQRAAAQAYGEFLRQRTARQIADDQILLESSNDIALRDGRW